MGPQRLPQKTSPLIPQHTQRAHARPPQPRDAAEQPSPRVSGVPSLQLLLLLFIPICPFYSAGFPPPPSTSFLDSDGGSLCAQQALLISLKGRLMSFFQIIIV